MVVAVKKYGRKAKPDEIELLKYVQFTEEPGKYGSELSKYAVLHQFYNTHLAESKEPLEKFFVVEVSCNGTVYFILQNKERLEEIPQGAIFEVVEQEDGSCKVRLFGEISNEWYGGIQQNEDAKKDKVVQKLHTWFTTVGSELLPTFVDPEELEESDDGDGGKIVQVKKQQDMIKEGDMFHLAIKKIKKSVQVERNMVYVNLDTCELITSLIEDVTHRMIDHIKGKRQTTKTAATKEKAKEKKALTDEDVAGMTVVQLKAAMKKEKVEIPAKALKKDLQNLLLEHLHAKEQPPQQKEETSEKPARVWGTEVEAMLEASDAVLKGELAVFARVCMETSIVRFKGEWKQVRLAFYESDINEYLSQFFPQLTTELVICYGTIVDYLVAEILQLASDTTLSWGCTRITPHVIKSVVMDDSELKQVFTNVQCKDMVPNRGDLVMVHDDGSLWGPEDTLSEAEDSEDEEEEEEAEVAVVHAEDDEDDVDEDDEAN